MLYRVKEESQSEAREPIFQLSKYENRKLFKYDNVLLLWSTHLKTLSNVYSASE